MRRRPPGSPQPGFTSAAAADVSVEVNEVARYDARGNVIARAWGTTSTVYRYDGLDRLTNVDATSSAGAPAVSYVMRYDEDAGALGRLTSIADGSQTTSYVYDEVGLAFAYDDQSNVSAISHYDDAGAALTSTLCLVHDALGRLVLAGLAAPATGGPDVLACRSEADVREVIAQFTYDAHGRRVSRRDADGRWTYFTFDLEGNPSSEVVVSGDAWAPARDYVFLEGAPLVQVEYPGPTPNEGAPYFFHVDHLNRPRALTSASGQVVWKSNVLPSGEGTEQVEADSASGRVVVTNLRFPGQYDERLFAAAGIGGMQGPYYNWNRWYLPGVGRYLELDPLALGGEINGPGYPDWYSYANANPLRYFDETGTFVIADDLAVAGIVAALGAIAACTATNTCPWSTPICRAPPRPPDNNSCEEHRIACIAHAKVSVFYCDQCARICEYSPGKQWPWNKPGGVCQY